MFIVNKISVRKIGVQPTRKDHPEIGKVRSVATLIGIARAYKISTSEAGDFLKFSGDFEAVRISDGETMRSSRAIFPATFANPLRAAIDADTDNAGVQFAAELSLKGIDNSIGYEWVFTPIGEVSGNADPLAALRAEARKVSSGKPEPAHDKKKK